jgi:hypothetical protein
MSTYKQFLSSDITITPFEVNKKFTFEGNTDLVDIGIDRFLGSNTEETDFNTGWVTTGNISTEYKFLVYKSIRELYYSNFLISSASDGTEYAESGLFVNYPQSDLYFRKHFPSDLNDNIGVISIPSKLYGNKIQPKTFNLTSGSNVTITDDGEGNLLYNGSICGNIIYNQGLAIITSNGNPDNTGAAKYGEGRYGFGVYGFVGDGEFINNFINEPTDITCSFSSSYDILETQYKCTINANEFNYSLNPSLLKDSLRGDNKILESGSALYSNFVTSSTFSPFTTAVGLYNDDQELVAIGKLAQPLLTSQTTDTTIFINIDR